MSNLGHFLPIKNIFLFQGTSQTISLIAWDEIRHQ